jgi:hypothetical protein
MQMIFLPYPSFRRSVACYSDDVVVKTLTIVLDNYQLLNENPCNQYMRWQSRNFYVFWHNQKQALIRFGMMLAEESKMRGLSYNRRKAASFFRAKRGKHWKKPLWVGWERLHSNHRAALLQIGEVERLAYRIIKWEKLENASEAIQDDCITTWFMEQGFSEIYQSGENYIIRVHEILDEQGAPPLEEGEFPNHYLQFNWAEQPNGEIKAWPPDPEESWYADVSQHSSQSS